MTATTDEEAFLRAIYADPDDDAPRLVFADWLDDQGDQARAEFIRLQCRMTAGEPYTLEDHEQAYSLEESHRAAWIRHLPSMPDREDLIEWTFHRGMPEVLAISTEILFVDFSSWARLPYVRSLTVLDTVSTDIREFARRTWNPSWESLTFLMEPKPWLHPYGDDGPIFTAIARSHQATNLRELHLSWFGLQDAEIAALCESPYLDGLRVLGVPKSVLADARLVARFGERLRATW